MTDLQKEEILVQTKAICISKEFHAKKKLCKLFLFIIDKALEGDEDSLKGYSIGLEIFDRSKDFKPENDPIVRIQVGRLRRSLELYYLKEGSNDKIRIIIPKGANIPQFIPIEISESAAPKEIDNKISKRSTDILKPTIAVLPFKNLTGEPEKDFFAAGFAEEISIELTNYEDFHVISCLPKSTLDENLYTSSDFINKLEAQFVIVGSLRIIETIVKISVKLTDTSTKKHLWAEQYRRDLSAIGLVELQEYIAQKIVVIIAGEYGIIPQKLSKKFREVKPREIETYDAILRFYYYEKHITVEAATDAFKALEQAVEKEPTNGIISSMLASLYGNAYMLGLPGSENTVEIMMDLAKRGVDLDPNNQLVRVIYAWTFFTQDDKERFFVEAQNALDLNPNSPLRIGSIGFFLSLYGDWERGKTLLDKAMKFNNGFPSWYYGATSLYYYRINDYSRAYEEALKYDISGLFWYPLLRAACLGQLNRTSKAKHNIEELKKIAPNFETKGEELLNRFIKEDSLVQHVFEGLRKAGIDVAN